MIVKNYEILGLIDNLARQYQILESNRTIRNAFNEIEVGFSYKHYLDGIINFDDQTRMDGLRLDDLYLGIIGLAQFIYQARTEIEPKIKATIGRSDAIQDRMAADNLSNNLNVMADLANDLYVKTVALDRENESSKRPALNKSIKELKDVGMLLTSRNPGLIR